MFLLYNILGLVFIILSPIFIFFRLLISKEDPNRFLEKFSISKENKNKSCIWFHGASIGEIMSILPIIKKFEKDKKIKKILITSTTISSASIISKKSFRKTTHIYYPFDVNFICSNFWINGDQNSYFCRLGNLATCTKKYIQKKSLFY